MCVCVHKRGIKLTFYLTNPNQLLTPLGSPSLDSHACSPHQGMLENINMQISWFYLVLFKYLLI